MTSTTIADGNERVFVVVFESGEEATAGLLRFAREARLTGAHLTAIGAFARVTLGFFDLDRKEYERIALDEQVELLSLVGNIALDEDGQPKLHAHVAVGRRDGTAHGGHLLEAIVRPTLEVVVSEAPRHLRRRTREELGLALLDLHGR